MRFRVLLALMSLVAVLALAVFHPSGFWIPSILIGSIAVYLLLILKAVVRPDRRRSYACAVVSGLSYLCLFFAADWHDEYRLPTSRFLDYVFDAIVAVPSDGFAKALGRAMTFMAIGEFGFSFLFALLGGALGAYWSRSHDVRKKA
jgi:hypothetical protein